MKMKNTTALLCLWAMAFPLSAQESKIFTHDQKRYQEALALYNNKQYQAAQNIFQKVKSETRDPETEANSAYYVANAAVRLNWKFPPMMIACAMFVRHAMPYTTRTTSSWSDASRHGRSAFSCAGGRSSRARDIGPCLPVF